MPKRRRAESAHGITPKGRGTPPSEPELVLALASAPVAPTERHRADTLPMPRPLHARRAAAAAGHRISRIQCRITRRGRNSPLHAAEQPLDQLRLQHAIDGPERGCGARCAHGRRACGRGCTHEPMHAEDELGTVVGTLADRRLALRLPLRAWGRAALWGLCSVLTDTRRHVHGEARPHSTPCYRHKARCVAGGPVCCPVLLARSCTRLHPPSTGRTITAPQEHRRSDALAGVTRRRRVAA
jgi:hypothetical protein